MGKRVFEVAKELGVDHRELLTKCDELRINVRNYMSELKGADVDKLRAAYGGAKGGRVEEKVQAPGVVRRRRKSRPADRGQAAERSQPARPSPTPARAPAAARPAPAPTAKAAPAPKPSPAAEKPAPAAEPKAVVLLASAAVRAAVSHQSSEGGSASGGGSAPDGGKMTRRGADGGLAARGE